MPKKQTMDAIENTLERAEDTVETLERIPKVNLNGTTKKQQLIILGTVAGVSATVGAITAAAWLKGKIRLRRKVTPEVDSITKH